MSNNTKQPRYIDANKIKLTGIPFIGINHNVYYSLSDVRKAIEQAPTEELDKLRRGEWKISCDGYYPYCSERGNEPRGRELTKFCEECGAKMVGEREMKQNDNCHKN